MDAFAVNHAGDVSHKLSVTHHLDISPAVLREVRLIVTIAVVGLVTITCVRSITSLSKKKD